MLKIRLQIALLQMFRVYKIEPHSSNFFKWKNRKPKYFAIFPFDRILNSEPKNVGVRAELLIKREGVHMQQCSEFENSWKDIFSRKLF